MLFVQKQQQLCVYEVRLNHKRKNTTQFTSPNGKSVELFFFFSHFDSYSLQRCKTQLNKVVVIKQWIGSVGGTLDFLTFFCFARAVPESKILWTTSSANNGSSLPGIVHHPIFFFTLTKTSAKYHTPSRNEIQDVQTLWRQHQFCQVYWFFLFFSDQMQVSESKCIQELLWLCQGTVL